MLLTSNGLGAHQYAEEDFYAVLVNEQAYPKILCLAAHKIKE